MVAAVWWSEAAAAAASGPGPSALNQRILKEKVRPLVCEIELKHSWVKQQDTEPKHSSVSASEGSGLATEPLTLLERLSQRTRGETARRCGVTLNRPFKGGSKLLGRFSSGSRLPRRQKTSDSFDALIHRILLRGILAFR